MVTVGPSQRFQALWRCSPRRAAEVRGAPDQQPESPSRRRPGPRGGGRRRSPITAPPPVVAHVSVRAVDPLRWPPSLPGGKARCTRPPPPAAIITPGLPSGGATTAAVAAAVATAAAAAAAARQGGGVRGEGERHRDAGGAAGVPQRTPRTPTAENFSAATAAARGGTGRRTGSVEAGTGSWGSQS